MVREIVAMGKETAGLMGIIGIRSEVSERIIALKKGITEFLQDSELLYEHPN